MLGLRHIIILHKLTFGNFHLFLYCSRNRLQVFGFYHLTSCLLFPDFDYLFIIHMSSILAGQTQTLHICTDIFPSFSFFLLFIEFSQSLHVYVHYKYHKYLFNNIVSRESECRVKGVLVCKMFRRVVFKYPFHETFW